MDELLKTAISQVPSLVVLAVVVFAFLRFIGAQATFIRALHEEHMIARRESREVIMDVVTALREVKDALGKRGK